MISKQTERC